MSNLRDRLKRIKEIKNTDTPQTERNEITDHSSLIEKGWQPCGYLVLQREEVTGVSFQFKSLPAALVIVVPDLASRELPKQEDFLFFDLETTGLSGGSGTVAFLAAFGRLVSKDRISVKQYLLLDYPGENDFLSAVLGEFKDESSVIVSYNGKCFDSQILKTRCLMNGIKPVQYYHVDLLHPARRLWKNVINDCSQASVETRILGLDRSGDIPGALAPEIWFEFLKTGQIERLMWICEHNRADIAGLASIMAAMINISHNPLASKYQYDLERLTLYWRKFIRRTENWEFTKTGDELLHFAAEKNFPHAAYVYAYDLLRSENYKDGRKRMKKIAVSNYPPNIKAAALRALAIDSERRQKDLTNAFEFVKQGLELNEAGSFWKADFEKRAMRLEDKLKAK